MKEISMEKLEHIIDDLVQEYGEEVRDYFNCHITNQDTYDKAVSYFKNFDGTKGPHWTCDEIMAKTKINFNNEPYTKYDYAYMVNMIYSDIKNRMDIDNIFEYAKDMLEDVDYPGDASERAYIDYKMRKHYFG